MIPQVGLRPTNEGPFRPYSLSQAWQNTANNTLHIPSLTKPCNSHTNFLWTIVTSDQIGMGPDVTRCDQMWFDIYLYPQFITLVLLFCDQWPVASDLVTAGHRPPEELSLTKTSRRFQVPSLKGKEEKEDKKSISVTMCNQWPDVTSVHMWPVSRHDQWLDVTIDQMWPLTRCDHMLQCYHLVYSCQLHGHSWSHLVTSWSQT